MPMNLYVGLMGSGKSFEVVTSVLLPALMKGRTVVSNIDGLNEELIREYLINVKGADPLKIGKLVKVTNESLFEPGFFPGPTVGEASVVQPGDLVCIDECWLFWSDIAKITPEHMNFFRMHRHYTDPVSNQCCDLALMIQDIGTLNRKIRAVIELTCRTVKLKALGLPTNYRVELYEGNKLTKSTKIDTFIKKYNKDIFPLYKSYANGAGVENVIDKRQNILTNPRLWFMFALIVVLATAGIYFTRKFFKMGQPAVAPGVSTVNGDRQATKPSVPEYSTTLRYVGHFSAGDNSWVLIVDNNGLLRYESPSVFNGVGSRAVGTVDGSIVTSFTGTRSKNNSEFLPAAPGFKGTK